MSKVNVAVRVRPFNKREIGKESFCVIAMDGTQTICTHPQTGAKKIFNFDHSMWTMNPDDAHFKGQEDVFQALGTGVIANSFEGYNSCIFAYGQTGSGKSYTMMGCDTDPGVIPRLCISLYQKIDANTDENMKYKVEVSYMEIYNEKVKDLLNAGSKTKKPLRVREHKVMGPYVEGLTKLAVTGYDAIETLMDEGNKIRHTAATAMNDQSSRSHAVFTLIFTQAQYDPATKQTGEKVSRLCLVDLAGSERQSKTQATGAQLKEGANINKSLTTLGLVISSLADASKHAAEEASGKRDKSGKKTHVPYRDSTLTWLLKDNLGGNSKTVMIAALSPASDNYDETMSTLRYADRAKQIVNNAVVNEDPNQRLIRELRDELERLRNSVGGGGGGGPANAEEAESLRLQLLETEGMIAEMTQSWEDKLAASNAIIAQNKKLLEDAGAQLSGGAGGLSLKSALPHFVSIADEFSYDITIYSLKEGLTRIGTSEAEVPQDVTIKGPEIDDEHCIVEHRAELDEEAGRLLEVVKIHPIAEAVFVNGEKIEETKQLKQGMVVQLGKSLYFRFNHPTEAKRMKELRDQGLLPEDDAASTNTYQVPNAAQKQFEALQKKEEERIAEEEARVRAAEDKLHADEAALKQKQAEQEERMAAMAADAANASAADRATAAAAQAELVAEKAAMVAERERVAAETVAATAAAEEARRQMEEAAVARQEQLAAEALAAQEAALAQLKEDSAQHEAQTEARLAAESAARRAELEAAMAAEVQAERAKMMAEAKAEMDAEKAVMAKELAEMKALMQAQVAAEAERSAAVAAEKAAADKAREEALATAAGVKAEMEAERKARLAAEESASAKAEQLEREHAIGAAKAEEEHDAHAAAEQGLKDQMAAFEAKLKEEQEKSKSGFEEQKRLRENLIKAQEGRLKATQQAQAERKAQMAKDREKDRLERSRKAEEAATAQSEKDEEDEKRAREKAKQEARAALAKSMGPKASPGTSAEAKLMGSMDFNLKKSTPRASGQDMFKKPSSTGSLASMGGLAGGPGQSNNPFALPTAGAAAMNLPPPIAASSNPFALPPATGAPPPMIPSRNSAPRASFNTDPGAHVRSSLLTSGHAGANTSVAPPDMDAYSHAARVNPATGAADYFGALGGAVQTSPFGAPPQTSPFGAPPPARSTSPYSSPFSPSATSKDAFVAAHGNDPYANPTSSEPPSNAGSDDDLDFDPTQWNGKGGSGSYKVGSTASTGADIGATSPVMSPGSVVSAASVPTSPMAPDNGPGGGRGAMTEKQKHDAMVADKIQQMMSLQREHMASRSAADEAQKKLAARHAAESENKKKKKFFSKRH